MTLRQYLFETRVKQREFADRIGVSESLVSRLKSGSRKPTALVARLIEKHTQGKVRAAVLLGLEKETA